jgi:hypothetical protein
MRKGEGASVRDWGGCVLSAGTVVLCFSSVHDFKFKQ